MRVAIREPILVLVASYQESFAPGNLRPYIYLDALMIGTAGGAVDSDGTWPPMHYEVCRFICLSAHLGVESEVWMPPKLAIFLQGLIADAGLGGS